MRPRPRVEEAYAAEFGEGKLAVQRELAKSLHPCCAEPKDAGHHPMCHKYEPPLVPEKVDGQESLL